jgi:hypothetical protein
LEVPASTFFDARIKISKANGGQGTGVKKVARPMRPSQVTTRAAAPWSAAAASQPQPSPTPELERPKVQRKL